MNGAKLAKTLVLWVASSLIVRGILAGVKNKLDGKDVLGRKKIVKQKTYEDYKGDVILGTEDYKVA